MIQDSANSFLIQFRPLVLAHFRMSCDSSHCRPVYSLSSIEFAVLWLVHKDELINCTSRVCTYTLWMSLLAVAAAEIVRALPSM